MSDYEYSDHNLVLVSNIFLLLLNTIQILANLAVMTAYFTDRKLRDNENIILLVSLAFIDFSYALLSLPYLVELFDGWVPNSETFNYNEHLILAFGSGPAALMKSGCTITTLVALDRICALSSPVKYYSLDRRRILYAGFVFALLMAAVDLSLIFLLTDIHPVPRCGGFACFTSNAFRTYWGTSNMFVNLLSCLLTIVVALMLKKRKKERLDHLNTIIDQIKEDKWANRASFYILIVSAIFGVIPGGINGCMEYFELQFLSKLVFFINLCASVSGVSHAFIFGMAHRGIRHRICMMLRVHPSFDHQSQSAAARSVARVAPHPYTPYTTSHH